MNRSSSVNKIVFPNQYTNIFLQNSHLDKISLVVDVNQIKQQQDIYTRFESLPDMLPHMGLEAPCIVESLHTGLAELYTKVTSIPFHRAHSHGTSSGHPPPFINISIRRVKESSSEAFIRIEYNPNHVDSSDALENIDRLLNYVIWDVNPNLKSKSLIKRYDIAIDIASNEISPARCHLHQPNVRIYEKWQSQDSRKVSRSYGTRKGNGVFMRYYERGELDFCKFPEPIQLSRIEFETKGGSFLHYPSPKEQMIQTLMTRLVELQFYPADELLDFGNRTLLTNLILRDVDQLKEENNVLMQAAEKLEELLPRETYKNLSPRGKANKKNSYIKKYRDNLIRKYAMYLSIETLDYIEGLLRHDRGLDILFWLLSNNRTYSADQMFRPVEGEGFHAKKPTLKRPNF